MVSYTCCIRSCVPGMLRAIGGGGGVIRCSLALYLRSTVEDIVPDGRGAGSSSASDSESIQQRILRVISPKAGGCICGLLCSPEVAAAWSHGLGFSLQQRDAQQQQLAVVAKIVGCLYSSPQHRGWVDEALRRNCDALSDVLSLELGALSRTLPASGSSVTSSGAESALAAEATTPLGSAVSLAVDLLRASQPAAASSSAASLSAATERGVKAVDMPALVRFRSFFDASKAHRIWESLEEVLSAVGAAYPALSAETAAMQHRHRMQQQQQTLAALAAEATAAALPILSPSPPGGGGGVAATTARGQRGEEADEGVVVEEREAAAAGSRELAAPLVLTQLLPLFESFLQVQQLSIAADLGLEDVALLQELDLFAAAAEKERSIADRAAAAVAAAVDSKTGIPEASAAQAACCKASDELQECEQQEEDGGGAFGVSSRRHLSLCCFCERHVLCINALLKQNPTLLSGPFSPLLRLTPMMLSFENKRHYFRQRIREIRHASRADHVRLSVRRQHVFTDSYHQIRIRSGEEMKGKLNVVFHGEEGLDGGGLTREWFGLLAREMFNPNYALFTREGAKSEFNQPNPLSAINPEHLYYFKFIGRVIGKALFDGHYLPAYFCRSFYKHMLNKKCSMRDAESLDPSLYSNLQKILEYPLEDLALSDLTFSVETDEFGKHKVNDLLPGGRHITELELLLSGLPTINVADLQENTEYVNYLPNEQPIPWFWEIMEEFDTPQKAAFLQFVTGTSRVPIGGFRNLVGMRGPQKFSIQKAYGENRLPSAHTCFNQLDLPAYTSKAILRKKLLLAITEGREGFGFGGANFHELYAKLAAFAALVHYLFAKIPLKKAKAVETALPKGRRRLPLTLEYQAAFCCLGCRGPPECTQKERDRQKAAKEEERFLLLHVHSAGSEEEEKKNAQSSSIQGNATWPLAFAEQDQHLWFVVLAAAAVLVGKQLVSLVSCDSCCCYCCGFSPRYASYESSPIENASFSFLAVLSGYIQSRVCALTPYSCRLPSFPRSCCCFPFMTFYPFSAGRKDAVLSIAASADAASHVAAATAAGITPSTHEAMPPDGSNNMTGAAAAASSAGVSPAPAAAAPAARGNASARSRNNNRSASKGSAACKREWRVVYRDPQNESKRRQKTHSIKKYGFYAARSKAEDLRIELEKINGWSDTAQFPSSRANRVMPLTVPPAKKTDTAATRFINFDRVEKEPAGVASSVEGEGEDEMTLPPAAVSAGGSTKDPTEGAGREAAGGVNAHVVGQTPEGSMQAVAYFHGPPAELLPNASIDPLQQQQQQGGSLAGAYTRSGGPPCRVGKDVVAGSMGGESLSLSTSPSALFLRPGNLSTSFSRLVADEQQQQVPRHSGGNKVDMMQYLLSPPTSLHAASPLGPLASRRLADIATEGASGTVVASGASQRSGGECFEGLSAQHSISGLQEALLNFVYLPSCPATPLLSSAPVSLLMDSIDQQQQQDASTSSGRAAAVRAAATAGASPPAPAGGSILKAAAATAAAGRGLEEDNLLRLSRSSSSQQLPAAMAALLSPSIVGIDREEAPGSRGRDASGGGPYSGACSLWMTVANGRSGVGGPSPLRRSAAAPPPPSPPLRLSSFRAVDTVLSPPCLLKARGGDDSALLAPLTPPQPHEGPQGCSSWTPSLGLPSPLQQLSDDALLPLNSRRMHGWDKDSPSLASATPYQKALVARRSGGGGLMGGCGYNWKNAAAGNGGSSRAAGSCSIVEVGGKNAAAFTYQRDQHMTPSSLVISPSIRMQVVGYVDSPQASRKKVQDAFLFSGLAGLMYSLCLFRQHYEKDAVQTQFLELKVSCLHPLPPSSYWKLQRRCSRLRCTAERGKRTKGVEPSGSGNPTRENLEEALLLSVHETTVPACCGERQSLRGPAKSDSCTPGIASCMGFPTQKQRHRVPQTAPDSSAAHLPFAVGAAQPSRDSAECRCSDIPPHEGPFAPHLAAEAGEGLFSPGEGSLWDAESSGPWEFEPIPTPSSFANSHSPPPARAAGEVTLGTLREAASSRAVAEVAAATESRNSATLDAEVPPDASWVLREKQRMRLGGSQGSEKVVLAYSLEGCQAALPASEGSGEGENNEQDAELLHGQEARFAAVSALKFSVSQLLRQKQLKHTEALDTDLLQAAQVAAVSPDVSSMETRYLSALEMEVITKLPEGLSTAEVLGVTSELPCVQRGFADSRKFLEEPDMPLSAREHGRATEETRGKGFSPPQQTQRREAEERESASPRTPSSAASRNPRRLQGFGISELSARVMASVSDAASPATSSGASTKASGRVPPNDPIFRKQWNLHDASPFGIHAEKAWRLWNGDQRPMVIAVIDSGCDLSHPDLKDKRWKNPGEICGDGIDNDNNGFIDDCYGWDFVNNNGEVRPDSSGHGTGAAGVLGSVANNLVGMVGVCWGCQIMCLKFIGRGQGSVSNQVQAIDYAVKMGAWISNNSYGGYGSIEGSLHVAW
ncbi:uba ts-n domain-containing protein [Cyclospora cayetanensis]|uniref:Uba ts-n domain-containing protein n=1 Tax=Cyclospora cayetanensis TaxID=88456 RepID=A0A1D3D0Y6_9EIME|nr:uba ts-n domain-containing protein [Cyclospora cayetanensis]